MTRPIIGIIGAGKLGITVAQLARAADYDVVMAGSGAPDKIALTVQTLAPGARVATSTEVAHQADIVILALPLGKFRQLPVEALAGKLIVDAMNYWWEVDGAREDILPDTRSSSEAVQEFLPDSRVVKAISHVGYHHLHDEARAIGEPDRKAIAVAGDDAAAVRTVSEFIGTIGFDPLPIGSLANGSQLEPGQPAFGAHETIDRLREIIHT